MKKTVEAFFIMCLFLLGCNEKHAVEMKDASELVTALSSPSNEIRSDAAASLQRLLAVNPSLRTNDHGEKYWKQRVESVRPGMEHSAVVKLLPAYDQTLSTDQLLWSGPGTGDSHIGTWRLDHYWTVTIQYRNPDTVIECPKLQNKAMRIWVKPIENYTGTWVTWHVNGHKSHEIGYKNGKYHGDFVTYHDNGKKSYQQQYRDGVCHGKSIGWSRDGQKIYEGFEVKGKEEGVWTHWFPDGSVQSRCEYRNGKLHGTWTTWYKDKKKASEVCYRNGRKHGVDREWDKNGKLLWSRHFENGDLVCSDPINETGEQNSPVNQRPAAPASDD